MSHSPADYLHHILDEAAYLIAVSNNLDETEFFQNETLKRAFVRSLEIIGEATKHIDENTRQNHPQIQWRAMAGMRDRLIHDYIGVDYDIVWDVVRNKMPDLYNEIQRIVDE